jgi:hypothetical protein
VYGAIAAGFYQADRMVRMIGNHDLRLRRKRFAEEFRDYYPDLVVYDAVVLVPRDATGAESGYPQVVILHGHQFDAWNNPLLGNFAGQPIVDFGSGAFPDFTSGIVRRKKWRKRMDRTGFDNVLRFHLLPHLPERRIPRIMDKTFDADHPAPHLILGHTHAPKWHSRVRKNDGNAFLGYTNSGTAGRYEELLWCVEIDAGQVSLHTWFRDGDDVVKRRMEIDEDDGHLEPA